MGVAALSAKIMRRIQTDFNPNDQQKVIELLATYGLQSHEREPERVRMAILYLAQGDIKQVQNYVRSAKWDYRDVLHWAQTLKQR